MLVYFTVGNFLSFNEKRTLSLEAKGISELKRNVANFNGDKLLRSAVVYGANSSGKSNLIKALQRMRSMVINSVRLNDTDELEFSPFLLSTETEGEPTFFEISFWIDNVKYRYGFEYNLIEIVNEWLFSGKTSKSEKPLFIRTPDGIGVTEKFAEGAGLEEKTNNNRLFISLVAQLGGEMSKTILFYFNNKINISDGLDYNIAEELTTMIMHSKIPEYESFLTLFQKLKLGFQEIRTEETEKNIGEIIQISPDRKKLSVKKGIKLTDFYKIKTSHNKFDADGNLIGAVVFDKGIHESQGTNKIIDLSGQLFHTLMHGNVLIIDELDAKLHPLITMQIVALFHNPETNPNNAQLIFATHDTNLLGEEIFRRDQIWFTEKDEFEQTDLYSLNDFTLPDGSKVRNDANIERNYIRGRYGAIPFITN